MNLTNAQLLAMSDEDQLRSERIALIMEGECCGEEEARQIMDRGQMELFGKEK